MNTDLGGGAGKTSCLKLSHPACKFSLVHEGRDSGDDGNWPGYSKISLMRVCT